MISDEGTNKLGLKQQSEEFQVLTPFEMETQTEQERKEKKMREIGTNTSTVHEVSLSR